MAQPLRHQHIRAAAFARGAARFRSRHARSLPAGTARRRADGTDTHAPSFGAAAWGVAIAAGDQTCLPRPPERPTTMVPGEARPACATDPVQSPGETPPAATSGPRG
jgi:hypothetical protein